MSESKTWVDVAQHLRAIATLMRVADLLESGDSAFSIKAYNFAADALEQLPGSLDVDLSKVKGVGKNIRAVVEQYRTTGTSERAESLRSRVPAGVLDLMRVSGIGPVKAVKLHGAGLNSVDDLEKALLAGQVSDPSGNLLASVRLSKSAASRLPYSVVAPTLLRIKQELASLLGGLGWADRRIELAGSFARGRAAVKDADFIAFCPKASDPSPLLDAFCAYGRVIKRGDVKASVEIGLGPNQFVIELEVVRADTPLGFGAAIVHATGSREHNILLRKRALSRGMTLSEYGLFDAEGRLLPTPRDRDVFALLDLPYVPPELRETTLYTSPPPKLVSRVRQDTHTHSRYSDGSSTIAEMARQAEALGLETLVITDHYGLPGVNCLKDEQFDAYFDECAQASTSALRVVAGIEVDILRDGALALSASQLRRFKWVVGSIHGGFKLPNPTDRLILAIETGAIHVLGHPTTALWGRRDRLDVDWPRLFKACAANNVALEINGARMDLPSDLVKQARKYGCLFALGSDAHGARSLADMQNNALVCARRAGLGESSIVVVI